jgi:hypothetical protein
VLEETEDREVIIERVAACDIGKAEVMCCVRVPAESGRRRRVQEVAAYPTMRCARTDLASPPADPGAVQQAMVSGRDRDGQQLGCPNLVGNRLTIGSQACDVELDGLDRSFPAFVDRAATGGASRQGRDGHEVAAAILGPHDDCVRAHQIHPVTTPPRASDLGLGHVLGTESRR